MKTLGKNCKAMLHYYHLIAVVVSLFCLQAFNSPTLAADGETIITAGPSWEGFTGSDGRGLYHDIIKQVFAGYTVKHIYVPTVQANSLVAIGRADIKICESREIESLVLASNPMYENHFYALYLHESIGPWKGIQSLKGKRVVWREGYYSGVDFSVPIDFTEVRSGQSAVKMVVYGRVDFYVDDLNLIKQSFGNAGETFNPEKFGLVRIGTRKYFPVFADTSRGEMLRNYYENGMERLFKDGTLGQIYKHWDFPMPEFTFNVSGK